MLDQIADEIADFRQSDHRSLAIITKTQKQAARLHKSLASKDLGAHLLDANSETFTSGVLVCSTQLAKGLEFDRVIIADTSADNYQTDMDRSLLYVACTRAMHRLNLFAIGEPSPLLPTGTEPLQA